MKLIIQKPDGTPLSRAETAAVLGCLRKHFDDAEMKEVPYSGPKDTHEVEIILDQDSDNVYAAALCPGLPRERIEVSVGPDELYIQTRKSETVEKEDPDVPFLKSCFGRLAYKGECELPAEVLPGASAAEFSDGVLFVTMPKADRCVQKKIPVN